MSGHTPVSPSLSHGTLSLDESNNMPDTISHDPLPTDESDQEDADNDSLWDADPFEVSLRAQQFLQLHDKGEDADDIWASQAFNRPLLGTENDQGQS